jgi:type I restriction-modification system DNA methylase subunit
MFVPSEQFVEGHSGRVGDIAAYGQDKSVRGQRRFGLPQEARRVSTRGRANQSNYTTWKLARMNLAIRGIDANLGSRNADTFHRGLRSLELARPVGKNDLATPRQMAISFHRGVPTEQFLRNYGIQI